MHTLKAVVSAIAVFSYAILGSVGCGGNVPTCDECLAESGAALNADGCWPYCEDDGDPPASRWLGEAVVSPLILARHPEAQQPTPVRWTVEPVLTTTHLSGVCNVQIPLSGRRFMSPDGIPCAQMVLPGFLASDSPDQWNTCDGATATLHSLEVRLRSNGSIYAEGGMTVSGCGRSWKTVLFQMTASRH